VCGECDGRSERDDEIAKLRAELEDASTPSFERLLEWTARDDEGASLTVLAKVIEAMEGPDRAFLWDRLREGPLCTRCGSDRGGDRTCYDSECFSTPMDDE
jgi:hypothetical protein